MKRILSCLLAVGLTFALSACDPTDDLKDPPVDLGDYKLGHNIVVVTDPQLLPGSRKATDEEWVTALTAAIDARFGRYEGARLYHFGTSVDAYNLAAIDVPGIPTPKSALGITVTIWDDEKGVKLNTKAKVFTIVGIFSGTGIQPTKQVQLDNLSALAAKSIEKWLLENPNWFSTGQ